MNGCVIVESRNLPDLVQIIRDHLKFLPGWGLTIFGSSENEKELRKAFPQAHFINVGQTDFSRMDYNNLLTSYKFWEKIQYRKILIFQYDSRILREGIDEFTDYDFCGAPWTFQLHGGNGGLSLRTKSIMMKICKENIYDKSLHGNEDVFFCNIMARKRIGKLAPREVCQKFSCESIFELETFGTHAIEKYLIPAEVEQIKIQYEIIKMK